MNKGKIRRIEKICSNGKVIGVGGSYITLTYDEDNGMKMKEDKKAATLKGYEVRESFRMLTIEIV